MHEKASLARSTLKPSAALVGYRPNVVFCVPALFNDNSPSECGVLTRYIPSKSREYCQTMFFQEHDIAAFERFELNSIVASRLNLKLRGFHKIDY